MALSEWIGFVLAWVRGAIGSIRRYFGRLWSGPLTVDDSMLPRTPAGTGGSSPILSLDGLNVYRRGRVLYWTNGDLSLDYDGAPNAYAPAGVGSPLDSLGNAGRPGQWWGIATDELGEPLIQKPSEPYPGYYISTTALVWPGRERTARYVDSTQISYLSLPPVFKELGAKLGDLAWVRSQQTGRTRWAIWADIGPRAKLGEGSQQLASALGVLSSPLRRSGIDVALVAGSGDGRPLTEDEIQSRGFSLQSEVAFL